MEYVSSERSKDTATSERMSERSPLPKPLRDSAALQRLMDEVRYEAANGSSIANGYDRAHNRHNR